MDFRQGSQPVARPEAPAPTPATHDTAELPKHNKKQNGGFDITKSFRYLNFVVLIGVTILLIAIALAVGRGNSSGDEFKYVNKTKYQAVFLNNGQVYFGNVSALNNKYVNLTNVFYLTQNTTTDASGNATTNGNYNLIQLGCQQIHDPSHQMIINRDQVSFWENLQSDGKVVTSIKALIKANAGKTDAQLCAAPSTQTQASTSNTQGSTTPTGTTKQ